MIKEFASKVLPDSVKSKIKLSRFYLNLEAKRLASTSKRLDICAAQIAHLLNLAKYNSLSGKICLEVGSGWILSHSIIFYLLGAKKIYSTDIVPIAVPKSLYNAVHSSIISLIRDILSPFEEHHKIRERLNHLLSIPDFDFEVLKELGIEYVAPIDFSKVRLNIPIDFIFSNSVFELIPIEDINKVLKNLVADLKPSGTMVHCIHLEDHKNIVNNPFEFLTLSSREYSRSHQMHRGNRLRKNSWQNIFNNLEMTKSILLYEWTRQDKNLPDRIDSSIIYKNETDIRVSHIGVLTKK